MPPKPSALTNDIPAIPLPLATYSFTDGTVIRAASLDEAEHKYEALKNAKK